jgi:AcrR family transcriptional regulator
MLDETKKKPPPGRPASDRMGRRRARTQQALLDAAETLFASRSVDAVNIDDIVSLADVAKGTFYNYFLDKDTLARELNDAARHEIEATIAAVNAGIDDAAMRVARAFCCVLRFGVDRPDRARAMMRMNPRATDPDAPINAGVRDDVRRGIETGTFRVPSPGTATILVIGVIQAGLSRVLDVGEAAAATELGGELGLLLLRGLGLTPAKAASVMSAAIAAVFADRTTAR